MKKGKIGKAIRLIIFTVFMLSCMLPISSYAYEGGQVKAPPMPPETLGGLGQLETVYNLWQLYLVKDKCPDYAKSEFEKKVKEEIIKKLISQTNPVAQFLWFAGEAGEYAGNSMHYSDIKQGIERYGQIRENVFGNNMPFDMKSIVDEVQFRNGMGRADNFLQKAINIANGHDVSKMDWTSADVTKGVAALEAVYQAQKWREQNLSSWEQMRQSIDNFLGNNPLALNVDVCARTKRNPGIDSSKYWDPNDMHIDPEGDGTSNWIRKDDTLKFTINFENIAEATANVPFVNITMPLPDAIDGEKIKQLDSSFSGTVMFYDNKNRVIRWVLKGIDLPPAGQGYVRFEAPLKPDIAYGTEFTCEAKIYFGYNPPISTPPVTRRVAAPPSLKKIHAAASTGKMNISWDVNKISAIDHYDLYVSENGGKYHLLTRINRPDNDHDPQAKHSFTVKKGVKYTFALEVVDKLAQSSGIKTASAIGNSTTNNSDANNSTTMQGKNNPAAPALSSVPLEGDKVVSGTALPTSTVTLKVNGKAKGAVKTDSKGTFTVKLTNALKTGDKLELVCVLKNKTSAPLKITTIKVPGAPVLASIPKKGDKVIYGTALLSSAVTLKVNGKTNGTVKADSKGKFTVKLTTALKSGDKLELVCVLKNKSSAPLKITIK